MFKCLKVLSIEMDLLKVVSLKKRPSLKGEVRRDFRLSVRPTYCESTSKIPRHLVQMLEIGNLIANESSLRYWQLGA
jgi:hypothetical protein